MMKINIKETKIIQILFLVIGSINAPRQSKVHLPNPGSSSSSAEVGSSDLFLKESPLHVAQKTRDHLKKVGEHLSGAISGLADTTSPYVSNPTLDLAPRMHSILSNLNQMVTSDQSDVKRLLNFIEKDLNKLSDLLAKKDWTEICTLRERFDLMEHNASQVTAFLSTELKKIVGKIGKNAKLQHMIAISLPFDSVTCVKGLLNKLTVEVLEAPELSTTVREIAEEWAKNAGLFLDLAREYYKFIFGRPTYNPGIAFRELERDMEVWTNLVQISSTRQEIEQIAEMQRANILRIETKMMELNSPFLKQVSNPTDASELERGALFTAILQNFSLLRTSLTPQDSSFEQGLTVPVSEVLGQLNKLLKCPKIHTADLMKATAVGCLAKLETLGLDRWDRYISRLQIEAHKVESPIDSSVIEYMAELLSGQVNMLRPIKYLFELVHEDMLVVRTNLEHLSSAVEAAINLWNSGSENIINLYALAIVGHSIK